MRLLFCIFFTFLNPFFLHAQGNKLSVYDYLQKYAQSAVKEMEAFGIPASIKLGQGILESSSGNSPLASIANNHFGIKCGKDWMGDVYYYDDDLLQECFRKYLSPWQSFRDHSKFLQKPRYQKLFHLPRTDYKAWARGLKSAGYATAADYAQRLITRIEQYQLWRFDSERSQGLENRIREHLVAIGLEYASIPVQQRNSNPLPSALPVYQPISEKLSRDARILYHENDGLKYIIVEKGESIEKISGLYAISTRHLAHYNDLYQKSALLPGQYFFLERKKTSGVRDFYQVSQGETMYFISQKLGIKLEKLYYRNQMEPPEEPQGSQILWLKGRKKR
ncbi:glycoside hydrolase family 73 protein [Bacteroidetes bacterium endosymbiont of Geopemphigus sp.]|uniref:glycoside hydrolase family 73 protein n=1 Tax=Bacteroidetes bacterium endosymbiont of Geopemphigus sp. TaxID=2047937 RepID=UPI000CD19320|nr:glucosaminidase domain-containing protein [Bacteroidetes bacterium endosymbiont of Geopemphigus sp.]